LREGVRFKCVEREGVWWKSRAVFEIARAERMAERGCGSKWIVSVRGDERLTGTLSAIVLGCGIYISVYKK
jgi:hypothetical protein